MAEDNNIWKGRGTPAFTPSTPPGTETNAKLAVALATTVQSGDEVFTRMVLGQVKPLATTLTTLYTAPSSTQTEVNSIYLANQSATATTFRIAVRPLGAAIAVQHYLFYDIAIRGSQSIVIDDAGIWLSATDVLSVYATLATVSFSAFGVQITART